METGNAGNGLMKYVIMAKRGKIGKPTKEPMSLQRFEEKNDVLVEKF